MELEYRCFEADGLEIRAEGDERKIRGYAAVFNRKSLPIMGSFREIIKPGAFKRTIKNGSDIRALWQHNDAEVLGRTTNGTLVLKEDRKGLAVEISPPDTSYARDALELIERGDVSQMSFRFSVPKGKETWSDDDGDDDLMLRTVSEINLSEVSPVTFPAYPDTEASVRAFLDESFGVDDQRLGVILLKASKQVALNDNERSALTEYVEKLRDVLQQPSDPGLEPHSDGDDNNQRGQVPIAVLRRRLDLVAKLAHSGERGKL